MATTEYERLVDEFEQAFIQRWDVYPRQVDTGAYVCVKKPLTRRHIFSHLQGKITLGVYLLDQNSQARFIVIDGDDEGQFEAMAAMAASLQSRGVANYLERSRRGGHLWLFFEAPVSGAAARQFGRGLIASYGLPEEIELYPKQDQLGDGPGSLIRLPFGIHRKDGNRYGFVDPLGKELAATIQEQIGLLCQPQAVPAAAFDEFHRLGQPAPKTPEFAPSEASGDSLSAQVKNVIPVYDFVSQYIELTPAGRGHCPFHDDQNRSFSVNGERNYWHCFSGCGGGSIIDFWMRYKQLDFKAAVKELAGVLLK